MYTNTLPLFAMPKMHTVTDSPRQTRHKLNTHKHARILLLLTCTGRPVWMHLTSHSTGTQETISRALMRAKCALGLFFLVMLNLLVGLFNTTHKHKQKERIKPLFGGNQQQKQAHQRTRMHTHTQARTLTHMNTLFPLSVFSYSHTIGDDSLAKTPNYPGAHTRMKVHKTMHVILQILSRFHEKHHEIHTLSHSKGRVCILMLQTPYTQKIYTIPAQI